MKSILTKTVLVVALLVQTVGFGQTTRKSDQIVKRNKQVVQAIITEINEKQVLYRDPTKPKNAMPIAIDRSEINKLVYTNGQEEVINQESSSKSKTDKISVFVTAGGGAGVMSSELITALLGAKSNLTLSYSGGLGVHIPIGSFVAVAPMATFTQFGGKFSDPSDAATYFKYSYQSAQFTLPILFTSPPADVRFFGGAGPYLNYAFAGKETEAESGIVLEETAMDFKELQNPLHFGVAAQAGVKMKMLSIFGYYTRSLSTLERKIEIDPVVSTFGLGLKVHF
jgi:outer membrane protein W